MEAELQVSLTLTVIWSGRRAPLYNNFLDLSEAKAFVAAIGAGIPDSKVEEYFKKYDSDGNGSLDKDECLKLVKDIFPQFQ